jgi:hypothetical protein
MPHLSHISMLPNLELLRIYKKSDGAFFCVAESIKNYDNRNYHQVISTIAIRNLKQFDSTAELKRMHVSRQFRKLGIRQKMIGTGSLLRVLVTKE